MLEHLNEIFFRIVRGQVNGNDAGANLLGGGCLEETQELVITELCRTVFYLF